jgi:hypothetical protein
MDIYIFQQEKPKSSLMMETAQEQENSLWINFAETNVGNCMISYGLEDPFNELCCVEKISTVIHILIFNI